MEHPQHGGFVTVTRGSEAAATQDMSVFVIGSLLPSTTASVTNTNVNLSHRKASATLKHRSNLVCRSKASGKMDPKSRPPFVPRPLEAGDYHKGITSSARDL
eukprot:7392586-Pyramimonas_sp.AAC.1